MMKVSLYPSRFGQRYAIAEDQFRFTVFRKLSHEEYLAYYQARRSELSMDDTFDYWLPIHRAWTQSAAETFLRGIGVSSARIAVAHKPGNGHIAAANQGRKQQNLLCRE